MNKSEISEYFAKFGKAGGKLRAKKLSPEQRSESAKKAAQARWSRLADTADQAKRRRRVK